MKKSCPYFALKPTRINYMCSEIVNGLKMKIACFFESRRGSVFFELYKDLVDNSSYRSALSVLNQWKKRHRGQIEIKTSV